LFVVLVTARRAGRFTTVDVSSDFAIPNPFGLLPVDFDRDMSSYRTALAFLSDLAGGSDHDYALTNNGGSLALLTAWKGSPKFRRVYEKCRVAAKAEKVAIEARKIVEDEVERLSTMAGGQRFVPLLDVPVVGGVYRPDLIR
jgi:hypothetical protein